jgi:hypothetical protein
MSAATDLLLDGFSRVQGTVHSVVHDLGPDGLAFRPGGTSNSVAWLVWHLTRVQDDHVAGVAGTEQVWTAEGWVGRFGLPLPEDDTGYGHDEGAVGALGLATAELLTGYHDAVHAATATYLSTLQDADFDRIVDRSWDPPVTLGVRLVSVLDDDAQHAGQAAYLRGLFERDGSPNSVESTA